MIFDSFGVSLKISVTDYVENFIKLRAIYSLQVGQVGQIGCVGRVECVGQVECVGRVDLLLKTEIQCGPVILRAMKNYSYNTLNLS